MYGVEFKRAAVQLSHRPGIQVQAVAEAPDIHPYMLSRWRKEFREGRLRPRGVKSEAGAGHVPRASEVKRLQELEREFIDARRGSMSMERLCRLYRRWVEGPCRAGLPAQSGDASMVQTAPESRAAVTPK